MSPSVSILSPKLGYGLCTVVSLYQECIRTRKKGTDPSICGLMRLCKRWLTPQLVSEKITFGRNPARAMLCHSTVAF
uniref:Uncharacterized protein n=1 Tax=Picea glauca TaxID=3330 RepID=A0A101M138_PICGL|nr:hypothetical protein ABT39_MTgene4313 [Picea glauca]QHR88440.1 hypothetical protein Q903MT_gene2453 [Picea sitchensis]